MQPALFPQTRLAAAVDAVGVKRARRFVAVDTETFLIEAGILAPELVCVSAAERVDGRIRLHLFDHDNGIRFFESLLLDDAVTLIFHNAPFDLAVFGRAAPHLMPLIFRALAIGRIADTQTREQLIMIRRGDMAFDTVKREAKDRDDDDEDDDHEDEDDSGESAGWKRIKKNYTLAGLIAHYLRRKLDKGEDEDDGGPRMTFAALRHVRIEQWPERHKRYAVDDAGATLEVFESQAPQSEDLPPRPLLEKYVSPDERMQVCAGFALHLCAVHGVRTDAEAIDDLETRLLEVQRALGIKLQRRGLVRPKKTKGVVKLSRSLVLIRALVSQAFAARGLPVPMSDPSKKFPQGQVSTSKETIENAAAFTYPAGLHADNRSRWLSGLPVKIDGAEVSGIDDDTFDRLTRDNPAAALEPLVAFAQTQKILGTYVVPMKQGVSMPMNSRPNTLVETGRTSWAAMTLKVDGKKIKIGANLQNFPRMPGVRECIVPRDGFLICSVDYESIELRTLAQAQLRIVGRSTLARRYQADPGYDPHTAFAGRMLGIDYAEAMRRKAAGDKEIKKYRQLAKAPNFGYPGGMGPDSLVNYAWKSYGLRITRDEAVHLRDVWFAENPEMREYFAHVTAVVEAGGARGGSFRQFGSGRVRGGCGFCDGCNGYFQGLAADGGKAALFSVSAECYTDPASPLFGCRPIAFIHDEILCEVHEATSHECASRIVAIMEREMARFVPDVPVRAAPALCRRWYKSAEAVYEGDRLVPWEPKK